jgi:hypothetical protein
MTWRRAKWDLNEKKVSFFLSYFTKESVLWVVAKIYDYMKIYIYTHTLPTCSISFSTAPLYTHTLPTCSISFSTAPPPPRVAGSVRGNVPQGMAPVVSLSSSRVAGWGPWPLHHDHARVNKTWRISYWSNETSDRSIEAPIRARKDKYSRSVFSCHAWRSIDSSELHHRNGRCGACIFQ